MSERSDLAEALEIIVRYVQGKGQLPYLDRLIRFIIGYRALCRLYNIKENKVIDIDTLIEKWSINAPLLQAPLWLKVVENLSKLNTKTEVIQQISKRKLLER